MQVSKYRWHRARGEGEGMFDARDFLVHAGVGTVGGVAGVLIGAPADTIKVLLQSSRPGQYSGEEPGLAVAGVVDGAVAVVGGLHACHCYLADASSGFRHTSKLAV
jgi:hypothetical protein